MTRPGSLIDADLEGDRERQPKSIPRRIAEIPAGSWTKWVVVGVWALLLLLTFPLSSKLTGAEKNDAHSWLPGNAESTKVIDVQSHFQSPNVVPAVIVYERTGGLTAADQAKAAADATRLAGIHGVIPGQLAGPVPSADGKAIETVLQVDLGKQGWNGAAKAADSIRAITNSNANGLSSHITGPLGNAADNSKVFKRIDGTLLYATIAVVIVILLITYRSPVLWLLPVLSAGVALITAEAVIYLLAAHAGLTVNGLSSGILYVLVFGASTDYALLIVARYREELRRHDRRHPAMAEALVRAGPAIIASGSTVIIALLTLSVAELNSTKSLGPVLAIGVAVGMFSMLTLLPALLVSFPRGVFWPYRPTYGSSEPTTHGLWARVGWSMASSPRRIWVTTAIALGICALGLTGLKAGGLTDAQSFRGHPDSVVGETALARHFPAGAGQPVIIIGNEGTGPALASAVAATRGIAATAPPTVRAGHAYLEATLASRPDSQAAYNTIDRVRAAVRAVPRADGITGGTTAVNLDVRRATSHDRRVIIPIILLVVLVILALLLRAVVAPLILIATVVLSFAAAMGVSALFFNHVFGFGGADTATPLYVFVFLVALGIDYNIFLMSRVREETNNRDARHGAITGLAATGGVITSAGCVLAATFAVLSTLPSTSLTEIGFAVAFGVLLDTIIVRSVLVTAINLDVGRWAWWPSPLVHKPDPPLSELNQERRSALAEIQHAQMMT